MLTSNQLLDRCGLSNLRKAPSPRKWVPATLEFVGAQNYVLSTKCVEVSLATKDGGFGLCFRKPPVMPTKALLGKTIKHGILVDVRVVLPDPMPTLSLAALTKGMYPRVLRKGEVVHV